MGAMQNRIVSSGLAAPEQLLAHPANWRAHPQAQQDALASVLDNVGWVAQVVVNQRSGYLLDGHLRVALAIQRNEAQVPVAYVDLSPEEEALILATLDPIAAMAATDKQRLQSLLETIEGQDAGVAALLDDIARQNKIHLIPEGHSDPDDVPEPPDEPTTKRGDVWLCGDHRIMCGDATSAEDYERLLDGASIDLVLTDPPYGVDYGGFEDTQENVAQLIAGFMPHALRWPTVLLTPGHRCMWDYPRPTWVLAWVHPAGNGRNPWGFTHLNPILAYGPDPYLAAGLGSRPDTLVLATDRINEKGHPTIKPQLVWEWLLERGSVSRGDCVLDPFLGSGTTVIAAERLGRRCYGMEIAEIYTDVSVKRWQAFTGRDAILAATGESFDRVSEQRQSAEMQRAGYAVTR